MCADAAQAMGRVVGSMSIVTARDGDAESAMLASWISQASFDPPGLTVAVKKDRAVESLLVRCPPLSRSLLPLFPAPPFLDHPCLYFLPLPL